MDIVVRFLDQVLPGLALHQGPSGCMGKPLNGPSLFDGDGESCPLHMVQYAKSFLPAQPPPVHLFRQFDIQRLQLRLHRLGQDAYEHP